MSETTLIKKCMAAVEEKVGGVATRLKVYCELDAVDLANPWTTGTGTFVDILITAAGGQNVG